MGCALCALVTLLGSYRGTAAGKKSHAIRQGILAEAAQSQALLETAMPPAIAHALLRGAPPESLTRSFECASVAFVALEDFKAVAASGPAQVMAWLNGIYTTFDGLVDAYGDGVNKVCAHACRDEWKLTHARV